MMGKRLRYFEGHAAKKQAAPRLYSYLCKKNSMPEFPPCPKCKADYTYPSDGLLVCPMCFHEWNPDEVVEPEEAEAPSAIKDVNGNILQDGDSVMVIKDLPVKGSSKSVKAGTKVKNIKLKDGDHNIDCRIEGFGAMSLKSIFVKKA